MAGFKGLKKYRKTVNKTATEALHNVALLAFQNLVTLSPVDLGNFRGRWLGSAKIPRIGNPYNLPWLVNNGTSLGSPVTPDEATNFAPALDAKLGDTIYITNNLHYATFLENGGSKQADSILFPALQKTRAQASRL